MKIEELMSYSNINAKIKDHRGSGHGYPLKITKLASKSGKKRLAIDVYEEPNNCHFKRTVYWQPIYIPDANRMYLVYSDKSKGYKMTTGPAKIGRISFTNDLLLSALNKFSSDKYLYFNWKWDSECCRPFIEIC